MSGLTNVPCRSLYDSVLNPTFLEDQVAGLNGCAGLQDRIQTAKYPSFEGDLTSQLSIRGPVNSLYAYLAS